VYNRRQSALELVYLCSLGGSTVMFSYYLLGGNTAVPSGLYARLCHTFLVFIPFVHNSFGAHSLSVAGPRMWNFISPALRMCTGWTLFPLTHSLPSNLLSTFFASNSDSTNHYEHLQIIYTCLLTLFTCGM